MSDSSFSQNNMGVAGQPVKLRDTGDMTYALATMDVGAWEYDNIAGAATTVVKSGAGVFGGIIINKAVSLGVITVYDNTAASGNIIATITHPLTLLTSQYHLDFKCKFTTGLTVVTSSSDNITVIFI